MTDECKTIDPTAFGLFFVAVVSLPLALAGFFGYIGNEWNVTIMENVGALLKVNGFFILLAALFAYKAGSNFGFIVFGLVSMGVFYAGYGGGELWINVTFGIIFLICLIWSYRAKTLKTLTFILLTTALVFIANGCVLETSAEWAWLFLGIAAILNFALTLYLAFALADEHIRCV